MKKNFITICILAISIPIFSQVTTSAISGKISTSDETLVGATVKVIHEPSGTLWGTVSNNQGRYHIQGLRVGGPYSVEVSYMGFQTQKFSEIRIALGEVYILNVSMKEDVTTLETVSVQAQKEQIFEKAGAAIVVGESEISSLPTIHRSIEDVIRLSPQAGSGNSFAGVDGRYNNITVDGASFKNGYGLTSKLTSGGDDAQPFSLDAVEEIGVSVAPFDIRQSHFTGADINLVTRSGDNTFKGSAYTFLRPKSLTGNLVGDETVANANNRSSQLYGLRFGGPIIKNKLFFFVNGEYEVQKEPGNSWSPSADGEANTSKKISRTTKEDMVTMKNFLMQQYGYDAGDEENSGNFKKYNYKILARLDWNINRNNKFSLRYNEVHSESDQLVNAKSAPVKASSERNSAAALSFSNSNFRFIDVVRSLTGEMNSIFSKSLSNKFLFNYSHIRSKRGSNSDLFPFVDIWKEGDQYMSFGYEPFSYGTDLINNVVEVTDNLSYYVGRHTLTAGLSFNYMNFKNNYRMYGLGYYRFDSPESFLNGEMPSVFALTYGYDEDNPMFSLDFGMGSLYVQDEFRVNERFQLTYGIRFEMPFYFNQLKDNPSVDSLVFLNDYSMNVGSWAKPQLLVSPRVGFNWNLPVEKIGIDMRGGSGIFTGFLPFVWFNEQPSLSGVIQNTVIKTNGQIPFATDYHTLLSTYPAVFPSEAENVIPSSFVEVDKNFKMPQVWRTHLGWDFKIPCDFVFTVEGLYSKDIQSVIQKNINEKSPTKTFSGSDTRDSWWDEEGKADNKIHSNVKYAMLLTNAQRGYQYSVTAQLVKNFSYNVSGAVAYTFSESKNLTDNIGTSAKSRFENNVSVNSLNAPELSHSAYSVPHHIVGSVTYKIEDMKHLALSISLVYQGSAQGRYSFVYANDMNGDGNVSDLIYVPNSPYDINFVDYEGMTAVEQQTAFFDYVSDNKYLNSRKGTYAERNGYVGPWVNRFDLRILQDIFTNFGSNRRYTLQLSLDVMNIGNLLNPNWGAYQIHGYGSDSYSNISLLKYAGTNDVNEPVYQLNASSVQSFQENAQWFKNVSTVSTWGCLVGVRVLF